MKQVDFVGINFSFDATESIKQIKPDIYFKGKDYKGKKDLTERLDKEIKELKKINSKIIFTDSPLQSSTKIINKSPIVNETVIAPKNAVNKTLLY